MVKHFFKNFCKYFERQKESCDVLSDIGAVSTYRFNRTDMTAIAMVANGLISGLREMRCICANIGMCMAFMGLA